VSETIPPPGRRRLLRAECLGSVIGFKHPALVSEQDCVIHFARFLNEVGVPWDAIHHQVSVSRWLFEEPHPAATAGANRWRVDLALLRSEDFLGAHLPATAPGFQFDACLEFGYLTDYWTVPRTLGGHLQRAARKCRRTWRRSSATYGAASAEAATSSSSRSATGASRRRSSRRRRRITDAASASCVPIEARPAARLHTESASVSLTGLRLCPDEYFQDANGREGVAVLVKPLLY
jgi:hypothetical protein